MEYRRLLDAASSFASQLRVADSMVCSRSMGVVTAAFFSILTFALAPSLMLGFAAVTAEVSCFTTAADVVVFTTAGVAEMVCILFPFKINAAFKKTAADLLSAVASTCFVFVEAIYGLYLFHHLILYNSNSSLYLLIYGSF